MPTKPHRVWGRPQEPRSTCGGHGYFRHRCGDAIRIDFQKPNPHRTDLLYIYIYIYSWFFNILIYLNYVFTPITKWNSAVSPGCLKKKKGKRHHGIGRLGLQKLRNHINTSFPTSILRNLSHLSVAVALKLLSAVVLTPLPVHHKTASKFQCFIVHYPFRLYLFSKSNNPTCFQFCLVYFQHFCIFIFMYFDLGILSK